MTKVNEKYSQKSLLGDQSVDWKNYDREELLKKIREELADKPIKALRHPEVRYEVTDHCNAECIMCPRDLHKFGRPHGIMDQANFEKSIDEVIGLGCKQIVLTGFGEPLVDGYQFGVQAVIGVCQPMALVGSQHVNLVDGHLKIGRSLWCCEDDVCGDGPLGTVDRCDGVVEAGLFVEVSEREVVRDAVEPGGCRQRVEAGTQSAVVEADVGDQPGLREVQ